eukprot:284815434_3
MIAIELTEKRNVKKCWAWRKSIIFYFGRLVHSSKTKKRRFAVSSRLVQSSKTKRKSAQVESQRMLQKYFTIYAMSNTFTRHFLISVTRVCMCEDGTKRAGAVRLASSAHHVRPSLGHVLCCMHGRLKAGYTHAKDSLINFGRVNVRRRFDWLSVNSALVRSGTETNGYFVQPNEVVSYKGLEARAKPCIEAKIAILHLPCVTARLDSREERLKWAEQPSLTRNIKIP